MPIEQQIQRADPYWDFALGAAEWKQTCDSEWTEEEKYCKVTQEYCKRTQKQSSKNSPRDLLGAA